jgi:hypothetical protein
MRLERIRDAGIGAGQGSPERARADSRSSPQIMESAIARIRDEIRWRSGVTRVL